MARRVSQWEKRRSSSTSLVVLQEVLAPRIRRKIRTRALSVTKLTTSLLIVLSLTKINPRRKAPAEKSIRTK
jgi:hypothetical protein